MRCYKIENEKQTQKSLCQSILHEGLDNFKHLQLFLGRSLLTPVLSNKLKIILNVPLRHYATYRNYAFISLHSVVLFFFLA